MSVKKDKFPLVSVIVITYNSALYVIQTLESIRMQTYKNIELIITDDCSTDLTFKLVENWVKENKNEFHDVKIITNLKNGGISFNCNQGINEASGEWLKLIGGDDLLMEDAIESYIQFSDTTDYQWIVSDLSLLKNGLITEFHKLRKTREAFFKLSPEKKLLFYINDPFFLNIPGMFYKKSLVDDISPFNNKYNLLEDQPFIISFLKNNIDIGYLRKTLVIYRIHNQSTSNSLNKNFYINLKESYEEFRKPLIKNTLKGRALKYLIEKNYKWILDKYKGNTNGQIIKGIVFHKLISFVSRWNNKS